MRKKILIGVALLLVASLLLSSCAQGVSQKDYDAVVAERDAAQAELTSLRDGLAAAEAQIATSENDLATAQAEIESLEERMAKAAAYTEIIIGANQLTEESPMEEMVELYNRMEATGDEELTAKWETSGQLWQAVETGEATEEEAMAAWFDWTNYVYSMLLELLRTE